MSPQSEHRDWATAAAGLATALVLVVVVRVWLPYDEVFRQGGIALAGNDPYFYRYWIHQLFGTGLSSINPLDLDQLPLAIREHDVLFIWATWPWSLLLGGGSRGSGLVLAWYPVVSAVVSSLLVFAVGWFLTENRHVALLSVLVLALTPAHLYRTMLGFGDHHAFDYVAILVTVTSLIWLLSRDGTWSDRPWMPASWWVGVIALGGGVAAQTLAWRGGPILYIPIGIYALFATVSAVRAEASPLEENVGLVAGLVIATVVALSVHGGLAWTPADRGFAPALLLGGVVGMLVVGEFFYRSGLPWLDTALAAPGVAVGWLVAVTLVAPSLIMPMQRFRGFLDPTADRAAGTGEAMSLVGGVDTPLALFGLLLVVGVPSMVWIAYVLLREHDPAWIVLSVYAWTFLLLSFNRLRFSGMLGLFLPVFVAIGTHWLVSRLELTTPLELFGRSGKALDRSRGSTETTGTYRVAAAFLLLLVLFTGAGLAQVPSTMAQITVDDASYGAAQSMADYSQQRGWDHPRNYVFSNWGDSRFYNYEVSGEAESYAFAYQNYRRFVSSSDADGWYDRLKGRTGFIVIRSSSFTYPPASMQMRLDVRYGSRGDGVSGLGHYRLIHIGADGNLKVFVVVPGATIAGNASADEELTLRTEVSVGSTRFTYERVVSTGTDGQYAVTVPYPGRYRLGGTPINVSEDDVLEGSVVRP